MRAEIAIARSVQHPALVRILDVDDSGMCFVMEFFSGGTLANDLNLFQGNVLGALRAVRPIVDAVGVLHRAGVVHRDIKPDNVFLRADQSLVLGDFGLAIKLDNQERLTDTFENVGTRDYQPPWRHCQRKVARTEFSTDDRELGRPELTPLGKCGGAVELEIVS